MAHLFTAQVEVTIDTLDAFLAFAKGVPVETTTPAKPKAAKPKKSEAPPAPSAPEPAPAEAPTIEDVRAVATKLARAGRQDVLTDLLAKYGATKLSGVSPGDFAALLEDLEAVDG